MIHVLNCSSSSFQETVFKPMTHSLKGVFCRLEAPIAWKVPINLISHTHQSQETKLGIRKEVANWNPSKNWEPFRDWVQTPETRGWISCEEWFWTAAPPQSVRSIYLLAKNKYAEITSEHEFPTMEYSLSKKGPRRRSQSSAAAAARVSMSDGHSMPGKTLTNNVCVPYASRYGVWSSLRGFLSISFYHLCHCGWLPSPHNSIKPQLFEPLSPWGFHNGVTLKPGLQFRLWWRTSSPLLKLPYISLKVSSRNASHQKGKPVPPMLKFSLLSIR